MEKSKHHEGGKEGAKKRRPHKIITTKAMDGSYGHEHVYHGESQPVFAGTSRNLEDVQQHHEDHWGGGQDGGGGEAEPTEPQEGASAGGE